MCYESKGIQEMNEIIEELYQQTLSIRRTEELIQSKFKSGEFKGTAHLCLGEEVVAAGVCGALEPEDYIFVGHRGHGFYICRAGEDKLIEEVKNGNSQHLYSHNVLANGITGGLIPVATGYALGLKKSNSLNCAVVVFGDGATGQGVLYESMNMASIWKLPIIYICVNNSIAMSSPTKGFVAGNIYERAKVFGMHGKTLDLLNYEDKKSIKLVYNNISELRKRKIFPYFLEIRTNRLCDHSVNK
jgi:TPP-dependent pyruvate/acetoin dehydrogenase alpha subunit